MLESAVQEAIRKYLRRFPVPVRVRKLADQFTRGLPDLQAIWMQNGHLVLLEVEVKRPKGGKLHALQKAERDEMIRVATPAHPQVMVGGYYVHVVARSVDDVQQALAARGVGYDTSALRPLR